jgi:transposase
LSSDPSHPTHNAVPAPLWQEKGKAHTIVMKSNTGRQRLTIVGGVNIVTHEPTILVTTLNCDRALIKTYLNEIRKQYVTARKIILILDNAAYQKSAEVRLYAAELNIYFKFLPPYSPNLALIERVWKFMKKKLFHGRYYKTFREFTEAICAFFADWEQYADEVKSLLTLNFEVISA